MPIEDRMRSNAEQFVLLEKIVLGAAGKSDIREFLKRVHIRWDVGDVLALCLPDGEQIVAADKFDVWSFGGISKADMTYDQAVQFFYTYATTYLPKTPKEQKNYDDNILDIVKRARPR